TSSARAWPPAPARTDPPTPTTIGVVIASRVERGDRGADLVQPRPQAGRFEDLHAGHQGRELMGGDVFGLGPHGGDPPAVVVRFFGSSPRIGGCFDAHVVMQVA